MMNYIIPEFDKNRFRNKHKLGPYLGAIVLQWFPQNIRQIKTAFV